MGNANGTGKGKVAQLKQAQLDEYVGKTNCKFFFVVQYDMCVMFLGCFNNIISFLCFFLFNISVTAPEIKALYFHFSQLASDDKGELLIK